VLALKNLFSKEYIIAWLGLPFFLIFFKKSRRLVYSYLIFLVIHIVIVANYLEGPDTARIYTPLLGFFVVLGFAGLFKACFSLLGKIQNIKLQNVLLLTILITVLSSSTYVEFNGGLPPVKKAEPIPEQVIEKMQEINPPCMYSTVPFLSAWFLDIPTIYRPVNNSQMLTKGPQECKHLFYIEDSKDERNLKGFLSQHGNLIFQYDKYMYYELID
ncbi:MAG: hypothetical protein ABFD50_15080, partial [Smithella sp.]